MRCLHTLKGSARLAGAMRLGEIAHRLETAVARLAADPALRVSAGARSRELARRFTPEAWADGVARLAERAQGSRGSS